MQNGSKWKYVAADTEAGRIALFQNYCMHTFVEPSAIGTCDWFCRLGLVAAAKDIWNRPHGRICDGWGLSTCWHGFFEGRWFSLFFHPPRSPWSCLTVREGCHILHCSCLCHRKKPYPRRLEIDFDSFAGYWLMIHT